MGYIKFALKAWPMLAFLVLADVTAFIIARSYGLSLHGPPVAWMGFLPFVLVSTMGTRVSVYDTSKHTEDASLTVRLHNLAARAGTAVGRVFVMPSTLAGPKYNAHMKGIDVFVTAPLRESCSEAMMDFVLAHEIAHKLKLEQFAARKSQWPVIAGLSALLLLLFVGFALVRLETHWAVRFGPISFAGITMLAALVIAKPPTYPTPELELWCDRKAVEITGDPCAAIEALQLLGSGTKPFNEKLGGYPTTAKRIEQVQAMRPLSETVVPASRKASEE